MFITFEGPEGSGKSTQIKLLAAALGQRGMSVVQTREPGGTAVGDEIRAVVHHVKHTEITAVCELLLYSASRAQLVGQIIRPALSAGQVVLCDRYADSTMAYQGYGRQLDLTMLRQLTQIATGGLNPQLTLLFDIDVIKGISRRTSGNEEMNRLDLEAISFHERVRQGYHTLAASDPSRWQIIDADRPVDLIQAEVFELVMDRLNR